MTASPGKSWGMRRMADDDGVFRMIAIDQRPPIMNRIMQHYGADKAPDADVASVKRLIATELAPHASALLIDPIWGYPACVDNMRANQGLVLTLEDHRFAERRSGRCSSAIPNWSVEKIKRIGGDGVKLLVWYRPDAGPAELSHQRELVASVGEACRKFDIAFVLELLIYPLGGVNGQDLEHSDTRSQLVLQSVTDFADPSYGVDLFKLESPLPASAISVAGDARIQSHFHALNDACGRPWVMLSAGADRATFEHILGYAFDAGASGFLAGRTIWADSFAKWPDEDAMLTHLRLDGVPYLERIGELAGRHAKPLGKWSSGDDSLPRRMGFELPEKYSGFA